MKYASAFVAFFTMMFQSCMVNSEPELFLIPDKYEGIITVVFSQKNGQEEKYIDKRRVYDIPENGILLTQFAKTTHGKLNQVFYYKDALRNKKLEIKNLFIVEAKSQIDSTENYIMNGAYGQYGNSLDTPNSKSYPIFFRRFTIGKFRDKDSLQKVAEKSMVDFAIPK